MSAGRVIGGIFALFGGLFVLIMCMRNIEIVFPMGGDAVVAWLINLLLGLLALIGGIMGLASKPGGGLALAAGLLAFFLGILSFTVLSLWTLFYQYSVFEFYLEIGKWAGISLESILMILGGIIMLASSKH